MQYDVCSYATLQKKEWHAHIVCIGGSFVSAKGFNVSRLAAFASVGTNISHTAC